MTKNWFVVGVGLVTLVSCSTQTKPISGSGSDRSHEARTKITGPYVHDNLAIYLVHGPDTSPRQSYLTLQEALEQKKIVVHETEDVNSLAVENVADDHDIYLMAGDIVRGGKQDRVLADDLLVSTKSGRVPIDSFCVERGRWARRSSESEDVFESSGNTAPGNSAKLAIRLRKDQSAVWQKVADHQKALSDNLEADVVAAASPTSLELTLDSESVKTAVATYRDKLVRIAERDADALGYVAVTNGKLNCGDIYGSHRLFVKLWPKLLGACATEAVAEKKEGRSFRIPDQDAVRHFLADVQRGNSAEERISDRVTCISKETDSSVLYESVDQKTGRALRRNYLSKRYSEPE